MKKKWRALLVAMALATAAFADAKSDALLEAASDDDAEEVIRLIKAGADVNARNRNDWTALMWAAHYDTVDAAKALIEAGADMNVKNNYGYTALMITIGKGSFDTMKVLIEAGADINARDNNGQTALMHTAYRNLSRTAKIFIEAGANVNAKDNDGKTALMLTAMWNAKDVAALLKAAGADMNATDKDGKTAVNFAKESGNEGMMSMLKAAGIESENASAEEAAITKPTPALGKTAVVTENLRLRTDDTATAEVVTTLAAGTRVRVLRCGRESTIDGIASNWAQVKVLDGAKDKDGNAIAADTTGWLFGGYLAEAEEATSPASAESERQNEKAAAKEALPVVPVAAGIAALAVLLGVALLAAKRKKGGKE